MAHQSACNGQTGWHLADLQEGFDSTPLIAGNEIKRKATATNE